MFILACLNRDRPRCLHSPHLLKLKVQYFSLPLVKTHTGHNREKFSHMTEFKACLQSKQNTDYEKCLMNMLEVGFWKKYEECKGKMTWGWMTVWCEIVSIEVTRHVPHDLCTSCKVTWPLDVSKNHT